MLRSISCALLLLFVNSGFCRVRRENKPFVLSEPEARAILPCNTTDLPTSCTSSGCSNCKLQRECVNLEPKFTNCISSEVCYNDMCSLKASSSSCSCVSRPDGSYPDPYNPHYYFTCVNGNENYQSCECAEVYSQNLGSCFPLPDCSELGCKEVPQECQSYYCCQKNGPDFTQDIHHCQSGEVYDEVLSKCISTALPTCFAPGPIVDQYRCDVYYVCSSAGATPTPNCCPTGQIYNLESFGCVPGSCPSIGKCYSTYCDTNYCKTNPTTTTEIYETTSYSFRTTISSTFKPFIHP